MAATIVRIPVLKLPKGRPIVVVVREVAETIVARYLHGSRSSEPLSSGKPLVGVIRSEELSSPDQIKASSYERAGEKFNIILQQHKYSGPLAANVVTEALVEIELGSLRAGAYDIQVTTVSFSFSDIQHPHNAIQAGTGSQVFHFVVA